EKKGRKYEYSPLVSEKDSIEESIDDLLEQMCSTKVGSSVETILKKSVISKRDLERLEVLIQKKKADAPEEVICSCTPGQCSCRHSVPKEGMLNGN
ncbi:MAG: BlaI/MecI/CopY family transcriptional regulator, partial [Alkalibacterium sp.]